MNISLAEKKRGVLSIWNFQNQLKRVLEDVLFVCWLVSWFNVCGREAECIYVWHRDLQRSDKGIRSPGSGVINLSELPYGILGPHLGPLQE